MTGWNRLFVVIAVCWALVAPFLLMAEANGPLDRGADRAVHSEPLLGLPAMAISLTRATMEFP